MIISIISLLICSTRTTQISAIEDAYPFKIDYFLLSVEGVFANNLPNGVHQINFATPFANDPNNLAISVTRSNIYGTMTLVKYYFAAQNLTRTGFQLRSQHNISVFKSISLAYLVTLDNFGLEIKHLKFSSFTKLSSTIYQCNVSTSILQDTTNLTDYFIGTYFDILDISPIGSSHVLTTKYAFFNPNLFNFSITMSSSSPTVNNISLSILVMNYSLMATSTHNFQGYYFRGSSVLSSTANIISTFKTCTNASCPLLYFAGITKGNIAIPYTIGHQVTNLSLAGVYDFTYLRSTPSETYPIVTRISGIGSYTWNLILLQRLYCTGQYKYLMVKTQTCYQQCPKYYYPGIFPYNLDKCSQCSQCSDISQCPGCLTSICQSDEYLNLLTFPGTFSCILCSALNVNCQVCFNATCTQCFDSSETILRNGSCISCLGSEYYESGVCLDCPVRCKTCRNETHCTSCIVSFVVKDYKCVIDNITYTSQLIQHSDGENTLEIALNFSGNISQVIQYYKFILWVNDKSMDLFSDAFDDQTYRISYNVHQDTNKLNIEIEYFESMTKPFVKFQLANRTLQNFVSIIVVEYQMKNVYHITEEDTKVLEIVSTITDMVVQNAMYAVVATSVLTKGMGAIMQILWTSQLSAMYIFLDVEIPDELQNVLKTINALLDMQLIPINIPEVDFDPDLDIGLADKYTFSNIDGYFVRENWDNILEAIIYALIFVVLAFLAGFIVPKNVLMKFLKNKMTQKTYCNVAMCFYSILITTTFSASVALTSKSYTDAKLIGNGICASIGLFGAFAFAAIHCIILNLYKYKRNMDTKECYFGLLKSRSKAEICLFLFLFNQLMIPVLLTNFSSIFTVCFIILFKIFNFLILYQSNVMQKRFLLIFRFLTLVFEILFNSTFILYYLSQFEYIQLQATFLSKVATASIVGMLGGVVSEILEMISEVISDIVEFGRKKYQRFLQSRNKENIEQAIGQSAKMEESQIDSIEKYEIGKKQESEECLNHSDQSQSQFQSRLSPTPQPELVLQKKIDFTDKILMTKSVIESKYRVELNQSEVKQKEEGNIEHLRGVSRIKRALRHKHLSEIAINQLFSIKAKRTKSKKTVLINVSGIQCEIYHDKENLDKSESEEEGEEEENEKGE